MFSLIWLLVGIIIGMLLMFLVIASYEEHASIKLVKHKVIGFDDTGTIVAKEPKKKSLKI